MVPASNDGVVEDARSDGVFALTKEVFLFSAAGAFPLFTLPYGILALVSGSPPARLQPPPGKHPFAGALRGPQADRLSRASNCRTVEGGQGPRAGRRARKVAPAQWPSESVQLRVERRQQARQGLASPRAAGASCAPGQTSDPRRFEAVALETHASTSRRRVPRSVGKRDDNAHGDLEGNSTRGGQERRPQRNRSATDPSTDQTEPDWKRVAQRPRFVCRRECDDFGHQLLPGGWRFDRFERRQDF